MTVDRYIRMIAGILIVVSVALGHWVNPWWFAFTAFVGLNLLQSAFTNWCPMIALLRKNGVPENMTPPCCDKAEQP
ncbi:MAG: YgaP family membrane protein [Armatimonadota bacterium]